MIRKKREERSGVEDTVKRRCKRHCRKHFESGDALRGVDGGERGERSGREAYSSASSLYLRLKQAQLREVNKIEASRVTQRGPTEVTPADDIYSVAHSI